MVLTWISIAACRHLDHILSTLLAPEMLPATRSVEVESIERHLSRARDP